MEEITSLLVNNGVSVAVVAYFFWYNTKFISSVNQNLTELAKALTELTLTVNEMRKQIKKNDPE